MYKIVDRLTIAVTARFTEGDIAVRSSIQLNEDNEVFFLEAFVNSLDMKLLGFKHSERFDPAFVPAPGRPPLNPRDGLKLYLYGYLNQRRSSRKLEVECERNNEVRWLMKGLVPSYKAISEFRKENIECIRKVFKEFVYFCDSLGLFGGKIISIDGSKFKAVNSKDRNFNKKQLVDRLKQIEKSVNKYLEELRENDEKLDRYISDSTPATVSNSISPADASQDGEPTTSEKEQKKVEQIQAADDKRRSAWRKRIEQKLEKLTKRRKKYSDISKKLEESGEKEISLTDPDSRLMKIRDKLDVCYNIEASVDLKFHLIPEYNVTNNQNDYDQLFLMGKGTKETLNLDRFSATADGGFFDAMQIKECMKIGIVPYLPLPQRTKPQKGIGVPTPDFYLERFRYDKPRDAYVCPAGNDMIFYTTKVKHDQTQRFYRTKMCNLDCTFRSECTSRKEGRVITRWENEEILEEMASRLKTPEGMEIIEKRKALSEHPFGTMKRDFNQDYLLLKTLRKVKGEVGFTILAYNMRRVFNLLQTKTLISALGFWHTIMMK